MPRIQSHDGDLAKQLRRAASSVPINLAEGSRRTGKDRRYLFTVAAGSADEVRTAVQLAQPTAKRTTQSSALVAQSWGYLDREHIAGALELVDRVLAMTHRLARR